mgnify:CR=1 FL=1|jgi:hypothetical protein
MPTVITEPVYPEHWHLRSVASNSRLSYRGHLYWIGKPFRGLTVAIAPTRHPQLFDVYYRHRHIKTLDTMNLSTMSPNTRP